MVLVLAVNRCFTIHNGTDRQIDRQTLRSSVIKVFFIRSFEGIQDNIYFGDITGGNVIVGV